MAAIEEHTYSGHISKRNENLQPHKKIYTQMLIAALSIIAKKKKKSGNRLSVYQLVNL